MFNYRSCFSLEFLLSLRKILREPFPNVNKNPRIFSIDDNRACLDLWTETLQREGEERQTTEQITSYWIRDNVNKPLNIETKTSGMFRSRSDLWWSINNESVKQDQSSKSIFHRWWSVSSIEKVIRTDRLNCLIICYDHWITVSNDFIVVTIDRFDRYDATVSKWFDDQVVTKILSNQGGSLSLTLNRLTTNQTKFLSITTRITYFSMITVRYLHLK